MPQHLLKHCEVPLNTQIDIAAKIEKLSRDVLWTRLVAGAALLCLALAIAATWRRHPGTLEANEIVLKDRAGNVTATLGKDKFGDTCLALIAKDQVSVANLCVQDNEGSSLDLHNLKSESRATLTPGFSIHEPDASTEPALLIDGLMDANVAAINVGTETSLTMGHNLKDSIRISSSAGMPKITLFGPNGNRVWSTP